MNCLIYSQIIISLFAIFVNPGYEKHILSKDCFCIEIFCNILYNEYIFSLKEVSQ